MPAPNIKRLLIAVALTAVVLILTHLPPDVIPPVLQMKGLDKVQHTLAYAFITLFFLLSVKTAVSPAQILFLLLFVSAIGIVDWLADAIGVAVIPFLFICSKNAKRKAPLKTDTLTQNADS